MQKVMHKSWLSVFYSFCQQAGAFSFSHMTNKCLCVTLNSNKNTAMAVACSRFLAGCLVGLRIFLNTLSFKVIPPPGKPGMETQGQSSTDLVPEPDNSIFEGLRIIVSPELEIAFQTGSWSHIRLICDCLSEIQQGRHGKISCRLKFSWYQKGGKILLASEGTYQGEMANSILIQRAGHPVLFSILRYFSLIP